MKRFLITWGVFMFFFASSAFAGILADIGAAVKTVATSGSMWVGLTALVLVYVFKAIPNQKIYDFVSAFFNRLGVVMTLGLTKWKWSAGLWNVYIEPWVIDLIENTVQAAVNGFIAGLRTDNFNG